MLTTNSTKYIARVANELGIEFLFHNLRHTHTSLLLQNSVNPKFIQERLGHARLSITLDVYSHVTEETANEAISALNNTYLKTL